MGLYNDLSETRNLGSSVEDAKCLEQSLLLPNYGENNTCTQRRFKNGVRRYAMKKSEKTGKAVKYRV